jgi:hypothetical protein
MGISPHWTYWIKPGEYQNQFPMTLREQILNSPETLSEMAWAAEERFREAEYLIFSDRYAGAVYLLGLASEMWLKLACFRLDHNPATDVAGLLRPARNWMRRNAPGTDCEAYHSLLFWAEYLALKRNSDFSPLPRILRGELRHHVVNRLFQNWKIDMRYRMSIVTQNHAWTVYNDTIWLREIWTMLARRQ